MKIYSSNREIMNEIQKIEESMSSFYDLRGDYYQPITDKEISLYLYNNYIELLKEKK